MGNTYNPTRTLTNIERVEVLKGPATGLYGTGAAGGVINMIEKKTIGPSTNFGHFSNRQMGFLQGHD